jgi:plasmid maintenance system killer protein
MELRVNDKKLKRALTDETECRKRFGEAMAKKIRLRIDALSAAESLGDFWPPYSGPERCHELKGDLAGNFSMDVKQPYRLLFRPVTFVDETEVKHNEDSKIQSEAQDSKQQWLAIQTIEIFGIENTHD